MNTWVRLWRDMPTDPKFRAIARKAGRPLTEVIGLFAYMMTTADDTGDLASWCSEDAGAALDMDTEHVEAIVTAMQGKVLDDTMLSGWAKRQPKRDDDSRERVRAFRQRQKQERNAPVTQCNAPDTETDTDTDTERTTARPEVGAAREAGGRTAAFGDLKNWFNGSTEAMLAFIDGCMGPGDNRKNSEQWLASTVSAHGQQAVAQAFAMIVEKRASGVVIAKPLAHWSNVAGSLKAGRPQGQSHVKPGGAWEILQRRKKAAEAAKEVAQ